jgi:hypothetical protein
MTAPAAIAVSVAVVAIAVIAIVTVGVIAVVAATVSGSYGGGHCRPYRWTSVAISAVADTIATGRIATVTIAVSIVAAAQAGLAGTPHGFFAAGTPASAVPDAGIASEPVGDAMDVQPYLAERGRNSGRTVAHAMSAAVLLFHRG